MNMCNVRTYVTHEYEMCFVRTNVTNKNVKGSNICFTRIWNVFCPNLRYIRKRERPNLHVYFEQKYDVLCDFLIHTKICKVWSYVTHKYKMCSVRTYGTYEDCYVRIYVIHEKLMFLFKMMLHTTIVYVRTYVCPRTQYDPDLLLTRNAKICCLGLILALF